MKFIVPLLIALGAMVPLVSSAQVGLVKDARTNVVNLDEEAGTTIDGMRLLKGKGKGKGKVSSSCLAVSCRCSLGALSVPPWR